MARNRADTRRRTRAAIETGGPLDSSATFHALFEAGAYFAGFRLFLRLRRRVGDPISRSHRAYLLVAAIVGAAIGSKTLVWLQHPDIFAQSGWRHLLDGKSVVGAILGGVAAVEVVKAAIGLRRPTGDLIVLPLCLGMALGRIGCFLSGLRDRTYGTATSLPWSVDFGDGVHRHPTQLYEIAFLLPVAWWALRRIGRGVTDGSVFQGFLGSYLLFRFALDFIKPEPRPYLGITGTQLACTAGLLYVSATIWWRSRHWGCAVDERRIEPLPGAIHGR